MAAKTSNQNGAPKPRTLTGEQQHELADLHRLSAAEVASLARPGEGFERVVPGALAALEHRPRFAAVLALDPKALAADFQQAEHLGALAEIAYDLYRRAFENKMALESEVYRALLKANRVAHSMGEPDVVADFAELDAWISSTHPGHGAAPAPAEPIAPAAAPGRAPGLSAGAPQAS